MRNKVLLINHNASRRSLFRTVLDYGDYEVVMAESGESGLRLANDSPPDVILLDLDLPDIGGLELISRIKGNTVTHNATVILCTDRAEAGIRSEALHRGSASILHTGVSPVELLKVVRAYTAAPPTQSVAFVD